MADLQEQHAAVSRLREATKELQKARVKAASDVAAIPEKDAAKQWWKDAIADAGRADVLPEAIAREADVSVEKIRRILYEAGLLPDYEPVARHDLTIRPPN